MARVRNIANWSGATLAGKDFSARTGEKEKNLEKKYEAQLRVLDAGTGSWASESARESAWNAFCFETARHHRAKVETADDFRSLLFHVRGLYASADGLVSQKSKYFGEAEVATRHEVADGAASAIYKIAELMSQGYVLPPAILEFIPRLTRDRLWAEPSLVGAWEGSVVMEKAAHSAAWHLKVLKAEDGLAEGEHPFYITSLGANPVLSDRRTGWYDANGRQENVTEVTFEIGRWRFGTECYNGTWSPWRRMLRQECGNFNPFASKSEGITGHRQGDVFFVPASDFSEAELIARFGESHVLEGAPDILQNVRVSDADGNSLGIRTIREFPEAIRTAVTWGDRSGHEIARPVYLVELETPESSEIREIVISHRDHAPVRVWAYGGCLLAAEARGATDYRPERSGGD